MTRKRLFWSTAAVILLYALAIGLGVVLRVQFPGEHNSVYETYKDLIPLVIALPAAYLAYAIQDRGAYLTGLRAVWSKMADGIGAAISYTELSLPTRAEQVETLRKLSTVIEEVRGMYRNVQAKGVPDGWYPFEPLKQIYDEVKALRYDQATAERQVATRNRIFEMWKGCRAPFLSELNIDEPTHHHAEYASVSRSRPSAG